MPRTFLVLPGRTVTLPQALCAGPGATNMRLPAGAVVTLEDAPCVAHSRFVRGRVRAADWQEIAPTDVPQGAPEARHVPDPHRPTGARAELEFGATAKKGT